MKKYIPLLVIIVSCFLTVLCLYRISGLKDEISDLRSAMNDNLNNVSMSLGNIYSNIDNKLEEQANILSSTDFSYGEADISAKTVMMEYSVVPKEYIPDVTSAVLLCNENTYPMVLENGKFISHIPLPLFEQSHVNSVQFTENGSVRTQKLNDYFSPQKEFLPYVSASYEGKWEGKYNKGTYLKKYNGDIQIDFQQKVGDPQVTSISLLEYIDKELVSTTDVPKNHSPHPVTTYDSAQHANEQTIAFPDTYPDTSTYYYYLDKIVETPYGSLYEMYIEVTDSYGLRHRTLVDVEKIDQSGRRIDTVYYHGMQAAIYDTDGNLVLSPRYSAYGTDFNIAEKIEAASGN